MIDDLTPLHQLSDEVAQSDFYLFKPGESYRMAQSGRGADLMKEGENHPDGVIINYYLKAYKETDTVQITIRENNGKPIQAFSNQAKENKLDPNAPKKLTVSKGGNRMVWNMRYPGFKAFDGMIFYSSPNRGPKAIPGTYKVTLSVNGESVAQDFTIRKDPRLPNTPADYKAQFDF